MKSALAALSSAVCPAILSVILSAAPLAAQNESTLDKSTLGLADAMDAFEAGDAALGEAILATLDPITADVARWQRYRTSGGAFEEITAFLTARPDWPGAARLRAAAERAIDGGHTTRRDPRLF